MTIFVAVFSAIASCFFIGCTKPDPTFLPAYYYNVPFWITIAMLAYLLTVVAGLNIETIRKGEVFEEYTIVNGCGDSFTEIPEQRVQADILAIKNEVASTMQGVIVLIIVMFVHYTILLAVTLYMKVTWKPLPKPVEVPAEDSQQEPLE